jgi:hypothetical protein
MAGTRHPILLSLLLVSSSTISMLLTIYDESLPTKVVVLSKRPLLEVSLVRVGERARSLIRWLVLSVVVIACNLACLSLSSHIAAIPLLAKLSFCMCKKRKFPLTSYDVTLQSPCITKDQPNTTTTLQTRPRPLQTKRSAIKIRAAHSHVSLPRRTNCRIRLDSTLL